MINGYMYILNEKKKQKRCEIFSVFYVNRNFVVVVTLMTIATVT